MRSALRTGALLLSALTAAAGLTAVAAAPALAVGTPQPVPGHTSLVPSTPRKDTPRISGGEIWDMEVVGTRVFVAGTFTSLANTTGNTATVNQAYLAAYDLRTGLVDTTFRPTFGGGGVNAVEASPDGTRLYVAGTFSSVNGVTKKKVAQLDLRTGAPVAGFTADANNQANALAVSGSTVYVGGRFTKIGTTTEVGLAALDATSGAVDTGFSNPLDGGIGVDGGLTVQQLKLTHDNSKLLVLHTGRKVAGQDRTGVAIIDTATKQLLPWRSRLWDDNLQYIGGIQRAYAMDVSPDDRYFVVTAGSGGDRPPISDTAVAFPVAGADQVQPLWVSRIFDSVYSVAITEKAVYVGGHFSWNESPSSPDPWPGLDNVGYGTGQGLSGYGLGDAVVRRDQLGALDPATGKALEWNPGANSFEGNKAMEATPAGLLVGGDGMIKGGVKTGRVAFFDLAQLPAASATDTGITDPIEGHVQPAGTPFSVSGWATSPTAIKTVKVAVQDRATGLYLQTDGATWAAKSSTFAATLGTATGGRTPWSLPLTITGSRQLALNAQTVAKGGSDPVKATKTFETFAFDDATPETTITGPAGTQKSTTFTVTGTATDDHGVQAITYWFRDSNNQYLQPDGSVASTFTTFRGDPDVIGGTSTSFHYDVTLPHEGVWRGSATAVDTAGQADLRSGTKDWLVDATANTPIVAVTGPVSMTPPTSAATVAVTPGQPVTFTGTADASGPLKEVDVALFDTTGHKLGVDGTWGADAVLNWHRITPPNMTASDTSWSWTTPFGLAPGSYSFYVRAVDQAGVSTSATAYGRLTLLAQVAGDAFPDTTTSFTGTDQSPTALHLDLSGGATDDKGVAGVGVALRDGDTGRYVQPDGTMAASFATLPATLAAPGATSTGWTLPVDLPTKGAFTVTAYAQDTAGQLDLSSVGATATYLVYPGDADPTLSDTLSQPVEGTAFTQSRVVVTGRALDDVGMGAVQVAVVNGAGQYLTALGSFTTTPTWIAAYLNSPGSTGSNYSYTTQPLPSGSYLVRVRAVDNHQQVQLVPRDTHVTVSAPAGNAAPVPAITTSCTANQCTFDGRSTTDEDTASLTYAWSFGNGRTGTGGLTNLAYTAPGTYTVTLTATDEYGARASTSTTVTVTAPAGNHAPQPVIAPPACSGLTCGFSAVNSTDPDLGDALSYSWSFGDGTPASTAVGISHAFAAPGSYPVTLTVRDGWGATATATVTVTVG